MNEYQEPRHFAPPPQIIYVRAPEQRKGPNHVLHGILTLFTGGLWLPIWLLIALRQAIKG